MEIIFAYNNGLREHRADSKSLKNSNNETPLADPVLKRENIYTSRQTYVATKARRKAFALEQTKCGYFQ